MILRLENFFAMPVIYVYDAVESAWQKQTTRIKPTAPRSTLKPISGRLPTKCAANYAWRGLFMPEFVSDVFTPLLDSGKK